MLAFSLQQVQGWFEAGGYLVLFGLLFLCGVGLPLPEDIPLLIAGFFVAKGQMHLVPAAICAWCGIIGGDVILYHLGKKWGLGITRVPFVGKHLTASRIERAETLFDRYGIWVVAIGRLFAGIRGAMVVAAGTIRYSFIKFIIADGLAAIVSGGLFIWLGHWVGKHLGSLEELQKRREKIQGVEHWVFLGIAVVVGGIIAYVIWRRRGHRSPTQAALDRVVEHTHRPGAGDPPR